MPSVEYQCPHCGKSAVIGEHFCAPVPASQFLAPAPKEPKLGGLPSWFWSVSGAGLVTFLLWRWLGLWSVGVACLALMVFFALDRSGSSLFQRSEWQELQSLCKSAETAERLVASELTKKPTLSRSAAIHKALERYRWELKR